MTIGVFVMGSTINPLIDISISIPTCLSPDAMGAGTFDRDADGATDPRCRAWHVYDDVLRRSAGHLRVPPAAGFDRRDANRGATNPALSSV
jgi:hypothetical protein